MPKTIKLGLIGLGNGGSAVLRSLTGVEGVEIAAAAEINPEAQGAALAKELGIPIYNDYRELLSRENVELVIDVTGVAGLISQIQAQAKPEVTVLKDKNVELMLQIMEKMSNVMKARETEEELRTILNSSSEGIQMADKDGIVRFVNPAFSAITGVNAGERIGKSIFTESPNGALVQVLRTGKAVRHWPNEISSSRVKVISNADPIIIDGELKGAVVVFQDITDLQRMTLELEEKRQLIKDLELQLHQITQDNAGKDHLIGKGKSFAKVRKEIAIAAPSDANVLLLGESGTGKGVVAKAIHLQSERKNKPFIVVNCAAVPENLLESELFGHEKGAFTGAVAAKIGKFELAGNGTVFLDEIGDMMPSLQAKLLRVLQEKQFERVGGNKTFTAGARIIAATNRNLRQMIEEGTFRQDLYFRLNVLRVYLPPLRERKEDIPLFIEPIINKLNRKLAKNIIGLSTDATDLVMNYSWPGNIRELENVMERAMHLAQGNWILPSHIQGEWEIAVNNERRERQQILSLEELEKQQIDKALKLFGSSVQGKKAAAKVLGISLSTLYEKIKKYNI